ncbi:hypothetical protein TRFO_20790 [Tritrichomonas foetus]|uniref:Uncharacterized protein n=1 Tax=Tritrichomonas foetus TaxID=1144522 RepID=A0A1J4KFR6_9EUKA|nr:hypothetical protein TRFO_20790 [Tritrichomonas foetus]|eukprot:OHT10067.1 hypothetical protein TRFO_20790 [Tritrichomonas foetus]
MCYEKPYGVKILSYVLFAQLSYTNLSRTEFFDLVDSKFVVDLMEQKPLAKISAVMAFLFINPSNLAVVSFRGFKEGKIWILNVQLFISSFLLTVASRLSLLTRIRAPFSMNSIRKIVISLKNCSMEYNYVSKFYDKLDEYYESVISNFLE